MERGQMVGPRIYHTGDIIYGAGAPGIHQDIVSMDEAKSALIRIKVEGGPSSYSYKNYNLPSRYVYSFLIPDDVPKVYYSQGVPSEALARCPGPGDALRSRRCK